MKLYYLGPEGTFSHQAALKYKTRELIPCQSLYEVMAHLSDDATSEAIVPIENAIEGTINLIADELIERQLIATKEIYLDIAFDAVGLHDDINRISNVVSIAPIISQTKHFITEHELHTAYSDSSIDSLNYITEDTCAIIPHGTPLDDSHHVIASNIEDHPNNKTRFLILSHQPAEHPTTQTLVVLTPTINKPGLLANILNIFNMYQVDLSWIESRPTKQQFGNYHFMIQCQTQAQSTEMQQIIRILSAMDVDTRVLGSF